MHEVTQELARPLHSAQTGDKPPVSFTEYHLHSDAFALLFHEGMALVEQAAAYLDGAGRSHVRELARQAALGYASESMRLTTRLMQITSWLLLQRAVNDGELTRLDAEREHRRVQIKEPGANIDQVLFAQLPEELRELVARSYRLVARIRHFDSALNNRPSVAPDQNPVALQHKLLTEAFSRR